MSEQKGKDLAVDKESEQLDESKMSKGQKKKAKAKAKKEDVKEEEE